MLTQGNGLGAKLAQGSTFTSVARMGAARGSQQSSQPRAGAHSVASETWQYFGKTGSEWMHSTML